MKKTEYIYIVTGLRFGYKFINRHRSPDGLFHSYRKRFSKSQKKFFAIISSRTFGWYPNLKTAKKCVEKNWSDIHEQEYEMAVIERVSSGCFSFPILEWWYKWVGNHDNGSYIPGEKPKRFKNIISFWGA
jgi:hypothetical protein